MRLVLDTNVLISAFATEGACFRLYVHCATRHMLVTSDFILDELREKLLRKLKIAAEDVDEILATVRTDSEVVHPNPLGTSVCRDADDDWIIATALTGQCECIVTGDRDLLDLQTHAGVVILGPGDFWSFEPAAE